MGYPSPCSSRSASDVVIGLATDAAVDELMRRAQDAAPRSSSNLETRNGDTPAPSPTPTVTCGRSAALTASSLDRAQTGTRCDLRHGPCHDRRNQPTRREPLEFESSPNCRCT